MDWLRIFVLALNAITLIASAVTVCFLVRTGRELAAAEAAERLARLVYRTH